MDNVERKPDPLVASPIDPNQEMEEHVQTYDRFVRLAGWFILHVVFLLIGLYMATLGDQVIGGSIVMGLGVAILVVGAARALTY